MRLALRLGNSGTRWTGGALSQALMRWRRWLRSTPPSRLTPSAGCLEATLRAGQVCQRKPVRLPIDLPMRFALLLWAPLAVAQSNLGELLDAGAKRLSVEDFKEEVVQRVIVGPTATGASLEVMYASSGEIQGRGSLIHQGVSSAPIFGEWTIDNNGRVCTSMTIGSGFGAPAFGAGPLPPRCQFWFKYAGQYFFSDSDSDRHARVFPRTVKQ